MTCHVMFIAADVCTFGGIYISEEVNPIKINRVYILFNALVIKCLVF